MPAPAKTIALRNAGMIGDALWLIFWTFICNLRKDWRL